MLGRRPAADPIAEMIAEERVTALWSGSPAMVGALDATLTAAPSWTPRSLKVIVYGWAALPPSVLASMKQHCGEDLLVFEIFGQTESISCHRFWPDKLARAVRADSTAGQLRRRAEPDPRVDRARPVR